MKARVFWGKPGWFPNLSSLALWMALPSLWPQYAEASCVAPPLDMVCWWRGEGDVLDATGYHLPASARDIDYAPGKVGLAWVLRTNTASVVYNPFQWPGGNLGTGPGLTVEGWINPDHTNADQYVLYSHYVGSLTMGPGVYVQLTQGGGLRANVAQLFRAGSSISLVAREFETGPGRIQPSRWTHFAMTYDRASGYARLYVDGQLEVEFQAGRGDWLVADRGFSILGASYRGLLDELSIYGRSLTDQEIEAIYAAGSQGKCSRNPGWILLPPPTLGLGNSTLAWTARAVGTAPLSYQWYFNNVPLAGGTTSALNLGPLQDGHDGFYSVTASNQYGVITSAPVRLEVRWLVAYYAVWDPYETVYHRGDLLDRTNISASKRVELVLYSGFPGGQVFYTLDGRTPDHRATPYTPPRGLGRFLNGVLEINRSCVLRAVTYSADLTRRWEMPPIWFQILPWFSVFITSSGGGQVVLDPPFGGYPAGTEVVARAIPDPGWQFLYWNGDAAGTSPEILLVMDRSRTLQPVFGTSLRLSIAGEGRILVDPPVGPYAYGAPIRLTAVPAPGYGFALWGGNVAGSTSSVAFVPLTAQPLVAARFEPLLTNEVALTVLVEGDGEVYASPAGTVYPRDSIVTLRAVPGAGANLIEWTGDVSGTAEQISVTLNTSKTVRARFTSQPLRFEPGALVRDSAGFRMGVLSAPGKVARIEVSPNLQHWELWQVFTNSAGRVTLLDPQGVSSAPRFYRLGEF
ncbi:MAG: LamG-like jellyroll fold domain-containing protein [Verrucomicrobiota bacterium]|nr:hypothetical protein [Limisphaera sp.]MDW8381596.1 LamG-like jellyroll fold domain-containing protein [Verrucomicrobiota bacterium]